MSSGSSSAIARRGCTLTSPRIEIRSPPRKCNEALAASLFTNTFSWLINCWTRARLVSAIWPAMDCVSRLPASAGFATKALGNVSTRDENSARSEYRDPSSVWIQRCNPTKLRFHGEDQKIVHAIALHEVILRLQSVARIGCLFNHDVRRYAMILSVSVAVDDSNFRSGTKRRA